MDKMEIKEIVKELSRTLNNFTATDVNGKLLCEAWSYQHRTIQQTIMGVLVNALYQYGNSEYYDLRNEASVKFAQRFARWLEDEKLVYNGKFSLPMV